MSATIVIGGQYGDEGKGKIMSYLALHDEPDVIARGGGGPNAGHSVEHEGHKYAIRLVPSGFVNRKARLGIGAGVLIDADVFLREVEQFGLGMRCIIDKRATLITQEMKDADAASETARKIGTTKMGIGPAQAARSLRTAPTVEADERLKKYLGDVATLVNGAKKVLVEGSQGFMISNLYGCYPYVTGKDVSASAICSEVGLGPLKVDDVVMVIKAYTTRVGGGPLAGELPVEEAQKRGMQEYGTVTGRPRRTNPNLIWDELKMAAQINSASLIALTKLDVKFPACAKKRNYDELPAEAKQFVGEIEQKLGVPVGLIGTGPDAQDIIDRRQ